MSDELTDSSSKEWISAKELVSKLPREEWTPVERAAQTAIHLEDFYNGVLRKKLDIPLAIVFDVLWDYEKLSFAPALNKALAKIEKADTTPKFTSELPDLKALDIALPSEVKSLGMNIEEVSLLIFLMLSLIYCIKSIQAENADKRDIAWSYACDAEHWRGMLYSLWDTIRALKHSSKAYLSHNGKKGAVERHKGLKEVKTFTIRRYKEGRYPSANKAAHELKDAVLKFAKEVSVRLSKENAQRTIAEWIRKHEKESV